MLPSINRLVIKIGSSVLSDATGRLLPERLEPLVDQVAQCMAERRQVLMVFLAEYLALGLLSAGMAVGLSTAAGWGLAKFIFETGFAVPLLALGTILLVILALTVGIGLISSLDILRRTPLEVLRNE